MLIAILYMWLVEPMAFQKEASARDLLGYLGSQYVQPEFQQYANDADCDLQAGISNFDGMGGNRFVAVECTMKTACGKDIMRPVWHEPIIGAYITADPFWVDIGIACPEMLTAEALQQFEENWQNGD